MSHNHLFKLEGVSYLAVLSEDSTVALFARAGRWVHIGDASWTGSILAAASPASAWPTKVFMLVEQALIGAREAA